MDSFDFVDDETPSSVSSSSATSSYLVDPHPYDFSSDFLKVPGQDLYIRPASRISTPRAQDQQSSPESGEEVIQIPQRPKTKRDNTYSSQYSYSHNGESSSTSPVAPTAQRPSWFSHPPPKEYLPPPGLQMASATPYEIEQLVHSLKTHRVKTLVELRRIEKIFANLSGQYAAEVGQPMTAAWSHYVNSHSLLSELRGITKNYPFSSEVVEEAKRRVYSDPQSNKSWNLCWLVLSKIQTDQLIPYYAQYQAQDPSMWGNVAPTQDGVQKLTTAFMAEWNWAVAQLLRYWDRPPTR